MPNSNVLIVTDEPEFARLLTACWQAERQAPAITVLGSDLWSEHEAVDHELVVVGPLREGKLPEVLQSLEPATRRDSMRASGLPRTFSVALPLSASRAHPAPRRLGANACCWSLANLCAAPKPYAPPARPKSSRAQSEHQATLGRYMIDMKHSVNNALTSMLGNAELLLLEPGQLSQQSLAQIKTIHSMALRINEIMQRFSSLASEMREAENASQAETRSRSPHTLRAAASDLPVLP